MTDHLETQWQKIVKQAFPDLVNESGEEIIFQMAERLGQDPYEDSYDKLGYKSLFGRSFDKLSLSDLTNKTIYCKFRSGPRTGTVARLVKTIQIWKKGGMKYKNGTFIPLVVQLEKVEVKVDSRPRSWKQDVSEIEILEGDDHETVFIEADSAISSLHDKFGKQPEMGRFVIAADRDRIRMGTVESITPKTFVIGGQTDNGNNWTHRVTAKHGFIVVDESLADDLLIYRLSM